MLAINTGQLSGALDLCRDAERNCLSLSSFTEYIPHAQGRVLREKGFCLLLACQK
jgi:hypothetical protein